MSQVQRFKASKPHPEYRARRALRELKRQVAEFNHDCDVAYSVFYERVQAHNVAACAHAPRASPAVH